MSDILIERMRKAARALDGQAIEARKYEPHKYLEYSDLRDLLEQAIVRIEDTKRAFNKALTDYAWVPWESL